MTLFEPAANLYQQALARPAVERASNAQVQLRLAQSEGELAWLIYIIGQVRLALQRSDTWQAADVSHAHLC